MIKFKIRDVNTIKITAYGSSTVALLRYLNNVELAYMKIDMLHLFKGNYLLRQN